MPSLAVASFIWWRGQWDVVCVGPISGSCAGRLRSRPTTRETVGLPIEDYAVIGDTRTAALVGRDGSIDWLCAPRFDSAACFAAVPGDDSRGHWRLAPVAPLRATRRRYIGDSLVLETEIDTDGGTVRLTDWMPFDGEYSEVARLVEGVSFSAPSRVPVTMDPSARPGPASRRTGTG